MEIDATERGNATARDIDRDVVKGYAQITGEIAYFESLLCSMPVARAIIGGSRPQLVDHASK